MSNFTSVTLNGSDIKTSTSDPAGSTTLKGDHAAINDEMLKGTTRMVVSGRETQFDTDHNKMSFVPSNDGALTGVFSSLKDPIMRRPINDATQITPESLITINGGECQVKTALMCGLLAKDAQGNLYDPATGRTSVPRTPEERQKEQSKIVRVDFVEPEQRETMNKLKKQAGIGATDAYFLQALSNALNGKNINLLCEDFAQHARVKPDELFNFTQGVVNEIITSGLKFLEEQHGVPSKSLMEYLSTCTMKFQRQILIGLYHNHVGIAQELIWHYKKNSRI